jgi:hypothetical protein
MQRDRLVSVSMELPSTTEASPTSFPYHLGRGRMCQDRKSPTCFLWDRSRRAAWSGRTDNPRRRARSGTGRDRRGLRFRLRTAAQARSRTELCSLAPGWCDSGSSRLAGRASGWDRSGWTGRSAPGTKSSSKRRTGWKEVTSCTLGTLPAFVRLASGSCTGPIDDINGRMKRQGPRTVGDTTSSGLDLLMESPELDLCS